MIPERSRSRRRHVVLVVRASGHRQLRSLVRESWTPHGQRVLTLPAEHAPQPEVSNRPDPAAARRLLLHAYRARHILADRAVLTNVHSTRRAELMQEIRRMKRVMRTLEEQIEVSTRSLAAMEQLVTHLQRVTNMLQEAGVMPIGGHDPFTDAEEQQHAP
ncbi:hypothetical protein PR003_g22262 [Phytophthora rubi]|uniref:Uncharacterized protein n=1 Tax=Phytophthora rubi TaxID=129364 RepID=A0A6A4D5N9_9STRA|nr:hypothetical protein PR002_g22092 [Phytophthora rubi]KAE8991874.1 hypothetical protein PR001_g21103 [Phytophthora rubi]KAE9302449.1 hypothetical protein PR003_g22262 [Phytophthora rubi]